MKFMLFAVGALAATQVKRQVSVVESAVAAISSGTVDLDNGIKNFQQATDAVALQETADKLIATINSGNSAVAAIAQLDNSAASLATPIQNLAKLVQSTVADLKSKKSALVSAGVGGIVLDKAKSLQTAAATFTTTTISKVPDTLKNLGNQLAAPIASALQDAVDSFSDQASGSSPTSGGASSATSAPTSSGAAATSSRPAATTTSGGAAATSATASTTPRFTGAAVANQAGFGAVAMAVLAGAAML